MASYDMASNICEALRSGPWRSGARQGEGWGRLGRGRMVRGRLGRGKQGGLGWGRRGGQGRRRGCLGVRLTAFSLMTALTLGAVSGVRRRSAPRGRERE